MSIKYNGDDVKEISYKNGSSTYSPNVLVYDNATSWSKEVTIEFNSINVNISGSKPTRVTSGNLEDRSDPDPNVTRKSPTGISYTDSNIDTSITNNNGVGRYNDQFTFNWSLPSSSKYHYYLESVTDNKGNVYTSDSGSINTKLGTSNIFSANASVYEQNIKVGCDMNYSSLSDYRYVRLYGYDLNNEPQFITNWVGVFHPNPPTYYDAWIPVAMSEGVEDPRSELVRIDAAIYPFPSIHELGGNDTGGHISIYSVSINHRGSLFYKFDKNKNWSKLLIKPSPYWPSSSSSEIGLLTLDLLGITNRSGVYCFDVYVYPSTDYSGGPITLAPVEIYSAHGCSAEIYATGSSWTGYSYHFKMKNFTASNADISIAVKSPRIKLELIKYDANGNVISSSTNFI